MLILRPTGSKMAVKQRLGESRRGHPQNLAPLDPQTRNDLRQRILDDFIVKGHTFSCQHVFHCLSRASNQINETWCRLWRPAESMAGGWEFFFTKRLGKPVFGACGICPRLWYSFFHNSHGLASNWKRGLHPMCEMWGKCSAKLRAKACLCPDLANVSLLCEDPLILTVLTAWVEYGRIFSCLFGTLLTSSLRSIQSKTWREPNGTIATIQRSQFDIFWHILTHCCHGRHGLRICLPLRARGLTARRRHEIPSPRNSGTVKLGHAARCSLQLGSWRQIETGFSDEFRFRAVNWGEDC